MKKLGLNSLLAAILLFFFSEISFKNFILCFGLVFIGISIFGLFKREWSYPKKTFLLIKFALFILWEMVIANLRVAREVLAPKVKMRPGVVRIPLKFTNDIEITILANLISLTPGTLTLDVSDDRRYIYIHAMFIYDIEQLNQYLEIKYEKPLMQLFE